MKTITADQLKAQLQSGAAPEVLDIREADEFASWHIHGSRNLPVYNALRQQNDRALVQRSGEIPKDRPVVTVCRGGIISKRAALLLEGLGFDAASLDGGMHGWGAVWSEAPIALDPPARAIQLRRNGKGCLSYLFGSATGAAIVDPSCEAAAYLEVAQREKLRITHVLETHVHADHLSRARELCRKTGAELVMPPNRRVNYPFTPFADGEELTIGGVTVRAMHTPGHTGESHCYLVGGKLLLTGDTLFVNAVGRPDLEKGDAGAEAGARLLFRTLNEKLLRQFDDVRYYPTHFNKPIGFDGVPIGSSLGAARREIDLLGVDEARFVGQVLKKLGAKPPNFDEIIGINEGRAQLGEIDWMELEAGPNSCAAG